MTLDIFFATHPVFTFAEVKSFLLKAKKKTSSLGNLLQYHQKKGNILLIRARLYAAIPKEARGSKIVIDPYLLASKLAKDAVLAYHTALSLHGKSHSVIHHFYYLTRRRTKSNFIFQGTVYQAVSIPSALKNQNVGIEQFNRLGLPITATSLERTFVDILDRPSLGLSWEEICRSIESIEYLNPNKVLEYTTLLGKRTTASVVGFFLEQYREKWMIPDSTIEKLKQMRSLKPFYLKRSVKGPRKFIAAWNLIIPEALLSKTWEEPHEDI